MGKEPNADREIFAGALECASPDARAAYLDSACGGDAELRARVEALLQAHDHAGRFLVDNDPPRNEPALTAHEGPGTHIGRYKLLEHIGEGGFGVVYMAEQQEPVRRRVALKIIKIGMDTRSVVARFEAERQALAMMDHPNIAKVFDGGATESGRPYFVMELVRGIPITEFCDENRLTTQQRLDLFVQVCAAAQHAHQKGVIHRDLKPSNVLVTLHDDRPVPKVIDFGIAKATDHRLTEKTLFTRFHQFIGTPAYMSPEQTGISGLDVDTRSDIYSLGVMLYELLTGRTPFDTKALLEAGYDEIQRTIREQEPPSMSTRLAALNPDELTTTAQRRRMEPVGLTRELRGDLDWIVMKCLEKDRTRRYETANELAMDIRRHLHSEPVVARPPSNVYRFHRLVRRNKLAFTAAGSFTLLLIAAAAVSTRLAIKAARAAKEARIEAVKNKFVADLFGSAFADLGPVILKGPQGELFRKRVDEAVERIETEASSTSLEAKAYAKSMLAYVYYRLGDYQQAERLQRQALTVQQEYLPSGDPRVAQSQEYLVRTLQALARNRREAGKLDQAERSIREALSIARKLSPTNPSIVELVAIELARCLRAQKKPTEVESLFRDLRNPVASSPADGGRLWRLLGDSHARNGEWTEAASDFARAIELTPDDHELYHSLAVTLVQTGDLEAYREHCRRIVARFAATDHPNIAERMAKDCLVLAAPGVDLESVARLADTAVAVGDSHPHFGWFRFANGLAEYRQGRFANAARHMTQVLSKADNGYRDIEAYMVLAMAQHHLNEEAEADSALAKGLEIEQAKLPKLDTGDIGPFWIDWIIAHALIREAKALIDAGPAKVELPKPLR
jgi:serine/threonine protein kinase/tetratricopeptide (TPR) repeat protein